MAAPTPRTLVWVALGAALLVLDRGTDLPIGPVLWLWLSLTLVWLALRFWRWLSYRIDVRKPQGSRITDLTLLKTGAAIDPAKSYVVAGWASVNEGTEGPAIWDVVESYIRRKGTVEVTENTSVEVIT